MVITKRKPETKYVTKADCQRCQSKMLSILADLQEGQTRMTALLQRFLDERQQEHDAKCPLKSTPFQNRNGAVR